MRKERKERSAASLLSEIVRKKVIQSATNVTDVPFVGSRMIAESCVKQIEEERARHIAKLTASDISTQVLHQIFTAGAGVALPSTHRTIVIF